MEVGVDGSAVDIRCVVFLFFFAALLLLIVGACVCARVMT